MSKRELDVILDNARAELDQWAADNPNATEPHDTIHEIADGAVPVYTADLMQLAADNLSLATDEPELGPAFDGKPTPANIVAANVFERIEAALWEHWRGIEEARAQADADGLEETPDA